MADREAILTEEQEARLRFALFHQIYNETPELANTERFARAVVESATASINQAMARAWLEIQADDEAAAKAGADLKWRKAARNDSAAAALEKLGIEPRQCWDTEGIEDDA